MNWIERRKRFHRRRRVLRLAGTLGAGLCLLVLAGAALPGTRVLTGAITLDRSRESVWRILTDLDGMPRWRSDVTRLERLPDLEGHPAWRETSRRGERIVQLTIVEPFRRLVMRRADRPAGEEWSIELEEIPARTGTLVRVTEREPVAPLARILAPLLARGDGAPRFLQDLARLLGARRDQIAAAPDGQ